MTELRARVDAVVFDMDGTLLDSSLTVPAAYAAAILELCGRECTPDEIIDAYSAGPAGALIAQFTGRPSTQADVDCWQKHLVQRLDLTVVYPRILEAVAELRARELRLGVFTGATRSAAIAQLHHAGFRDLLDTVVGSDEIERVKPAPDGVLLATARLGVAPARTAYVGDAPNDLRCARAAGATAVAAAWGHLYEPAAEAHLIAQSPDDLIALLCTDTS